MKIKLLSEDARMPSYGSTEAAGIDLHSAFDYTIQPQQRQQVGTKIAIAIPKGYYGRIAPRSGLAVRKGIDVLGGVIDSDYRGEVIVILYNTDSFNTVQIEKGDRVAQLIITPYEKVRLDKVEELGDTDRGNQGFGSTGK